AVHDEGDLHVLRILQPIGVGCHCASRTKHEGGESNATKVLHILTPLFPCGGISPPDAKAPPAIASACNIDAIFSRPPSRCWSIACRSTMCAPLNQHAPAETCPPAHAAWPKPAIPTGCPCR